MADHYPDQVTTVLRDMELLKRSTVAEVGMTLTTGYDNIRRLFEPNAPIIGERIKTLGELHSAGVKTFAMIAPALPGADILTDMLEGKVDHVLIDRMNYHYADWVYRKHKLGNPVSSVKSQDLRSGFEERGISCRVLY